ncbi:hypothetical protein LQZ44_06465 [Alcaligenes nematophilus]|jgi:hypothetical protein|uniref:Uncharacterized protein n=2 Tax=Alcaligenes nematophilus TaxID=2994643 RepID=A0ABU3MUV8_9BURK|nr:MULTISPECIES: hypothetical protein [Alcaligenes]KVX03812.1 hypothetical protein ASL22_09345 [Alcaligenes faecalis]MCB4324194.1 hypothetical protein [Alcaligenes sp. 13f]MDT8505357.1 hypothetical protein [Alcaligenes nematophilus]QCP82243.1 hypothetical protein D0C27_10235 [Alcaligenes faecalis]QRF91047.1 hypothetical protein CLH39_12780 [Alcaligenes faecalis]
MSPYPRWRVFLSFLLCPVLAGPFIGVWLALSGSQPGDEAWVVLVGSMAGALLAALNALVFYGVPALLLALLYSVVKPTKTGLSVLLITILGALTALFWNMFVFPGLKDWASALLGGGTSLFMALWALPKQSPNSHLKGTMSDT